MNDWDKRNVIEDARRAGATGGYFDPYSISDYRLREDAIRAHNDAKHPSPYGQLPFNIPLILFLGAVVGVPVYRKLSPIWDRLSDGKQILILLLIIFVPLALLAFYKFAVLKIFAYLNKVVAKITFDPKTGKVRSWIRVSSYTVIAILGLGVAFLLLAIFTTNH